MGSRLGPLMACAFLCSIEEKLEHEKKITRIWKKYVDDIFAIMPNVPTATAFLSASVVVGHGPKGMADHYISQSRAVS